MMFLSSRHDRWSQEVNAQSTPKPQNDLLSNTIWDASQRRLLSVQFEKLGTGKNPLLDLAAPLRTQPVGTAHRLSRNSDSSGSNPFPTAWAHSLFWFLRVLVICFVRVLVTRRPGAGRAFRQEGNSGQASEILPPKKERRPSEPSTKKAGSGCNPMALG